MNYLGSDFNSSGSVMAKAELTVARAKRGECVTCGRKCYRKKLFKMVPLDDPGKVLNGRCLNCNPLQSKDVSMPSTPHSGSRNPRTRGNRKISNSSSNASGKIPNSRRMAMRKKKDSSHLHHHSSPQLWVSSGNKDGVAVDGADAATKGKAKSPPERTNSTPPLTSSYFNNSPTMTHNRVNSMHSSSSRATADTALTTRPSITSSSTTARKNTGSVSTLSVESRTSYMVPINDSQRCNSYSSSGRSLTVTDSFGSSVSERTIPKSPEISWTPPPHHSGFKSNDDDPNNANGNGIDKSSKIHIRTPSRLDSLVSFKSTASKTNPPTRDELEKAAFTLMAAQQHGITSADGPLYQDIFNELMPSERNQDSDQYTDYSAQADSPKKIPISNGTDSITGNTKESENIDDDENVENCNNVNSKRDGDVSLKSSLVEPVLSSNAETKQSSRNIRNEDLEQNSTIVESNVSVPKTVSIDEQDDQVLSLCSQLWLQNHRKRGTLNRGGAFQPRYARPGVGTNIFARSMRSMSSMSSIGEDDHLLAQKSQESKPSKSSNRRMNLHRMGSFSRYRQESCRTLGSLSAIEVINEEDSGIHSSLDDFSFGLSVEKEDFGDSQYESQPLNPEPRTNDLGGRKIAAHFNDEEEDNDTSTSNVFQDQLIILRESSDSPDRTKKALKILSEYDTAFDNEDDIDLGSMKFVVICMQYHATVYDVQLWGCRAILNLSSWRAKVQSAFAQAGAPDVIAQAMKYFLESGEELQEQAITTISNLAFDSSNMNYLLGKGYDAVEAIIAAMGRYPENAGVQRKGCEVLTILTSHNDSLLRNRIMDKRAGEAILFNAMTMHLEDFIVQKSALSAVRNLCTDCEENQSKFLDLGVIDPILNAMRKHRSVAGLQEAGAGTISILAGNHIETKKVIQKNGGIEIILRAMLDHSNFSKGKACYVRTLMTLALDSYNYNNSESRITKDNIKIARVINDMIDTINTSQANLSKLSLAIGAVITSMEKHEDEPAVQEIGCAILGGLADLVEEGIATNSHQTKMDIVDEGALDVINMAMVLHQQEARVQERACALLLSLAIEENYSAILAAIGFQLLKDAAEDYPDRCYKTANTLIERLGEEDNNEETVEDNNFIE